MGDLNLENVSETLWIPLFGKAIESKRNHPLIFDSKALEIANKACEIEPQLAKWWRNLSKESQGLMIWRNQAIDSMTQEYLDKHPDGCVVNLGAGLCTRYERFKNDKLKWVELDMPEVKGAWLNFNEETNEHQYWTDNIFENQWIDKLASIQTKNILFIAEGLFMYFSKSEVTDIINRINNRFRNSYFILEVYSKWVLMRPHPDVKITGAKKFKSPWGVYTGKDFEKWLPNLQHVKDDYFLENKLALKRLPTLHNFGGKLPFFKKAGKIVFLNLV